MDNKMNLNNKLISLVEDGLSVEDAASVLGLDPDHAREVITNNQAINASKENDDPDKIIEENKPKAIRKLIQIGLNESIENVSARVAALRAIIEHKSLNTEAENNKIQEMFKKMTEVSNKYEAELQKRKEATTVVIPQSTTTGTTPNATEGFKEKFRLAKEKESQQLDYAV